MDMQQRAGKKSSDAVWKFSTCKCLVKSSWHNFTIYASKKDCLLLSSDAFWTFSPDEVYEESLGLIFTIYASENKAVSCEI